MNAADRALATFREEARTWLEQHVPTEARPTEGSEVRAFDAAWQRTQHDGGWAGIDWPTEYGGRGLSLFEQVVWYEELVRAGAPTFSCFLVALNNVGPTLMLHGTEEQRHHHLGRILSGESPWCQGFSEPEAGSDLASLRTRAEFDGDELVVSGQKIWTSFAQWADYGEVLVRTDSDTSSKHRGLTLLIVDMSSPGVEVRPIRQIDGNPEFCEVFFDEVRVPVADVLGEINNGWHAAMSTLAVERGPAVLDMRLASIIHSDAMIAEARERGLLEDRRIASRLARLRADGAAVRAMAYQQVSDATPGARPGPETTAIRAFHVQLEQRIARMGVDLLGAESLQSGEAADLWLRQFMSTIGGGTIDVQKNVIGERVLGLPR